jgi:arylsulfatase A-like enzyme
MFLQVRVPLIVRQPGGKLGGRRVRDQVGLIDLAPTLTELGGADPAPTFTGRSLVPYLRGERSPRPEAVFEEFRAACRGVAQTLRVGSVGERLDPERARALRALGYVE